MTSTAAARRRRRVHREQARARILAAAEEFLRTRPFRELTVEELMKAAGLPRTVFYRHFADLHEMVLRLLQKIVSELSEFAREWAASVGQFSDLGRANFERVVDFFARNGPLIRAVADAAAGDEELERVYGGFIDGFDELTGRALERLVDEGRIAALDVPQTARALTLLNERYLLDAFGREPMTDRERVSEALWTIWRRTVFYPAGGDRPTVP
ncbi:MAG TPA: TetR/AcrR family transcriptional regulator [Solirubrobacterales bacterium]|jgi:AcrR family transcriptional regulator|nr:TetR/AcrR family transcriptional regulator [Solirubrobacterales bacterium]